MEGESLLKTITLSFADLLQEPDLQKVVQSIKRSSGELITSDEESQIEAESSVSKKLTRILEIATRRGQNGISELHTAFCKTKNLHLAERLQYFVRNKTIVWPPRDGELIEMMHRNVTLCSPDSVRVFESYRDEDKVYRMRNKNRGLAVIINNKCFDAPSLKYRIGSDKDQNAMKQVLQQLHFTVKSFENLTAQEMIQTAKLESKNKIHQTADCFVFVVLSHGDYEGVYGVDGKTVTVEELSKPFYTLGCKELENKPKIFIFQACRGSNEETSAPVSKETGKSTVELPQPDHFGQSLLEAFKEPLDDDKANPETSAPVSMKTTEGTTELSQPDYIRQDPLEDVEYTNPEASAPVSKKTTEGMTELSQPDYFGQDILEGYVEGKNNKNNKEEASMDIEMQDNLNKEDENVLKYYAAQINRGISLTESDEGQEFVSEDVATASLFTKGGDTGRFDTDPVDDPTDITLTSQDETLLEYYRAQEKRGIPFTTVSAERYSFNELDEEEDAEVCSDGGNTSWSDTKGMYVDDPTDLSPASKAKNLLKYYRAQEKRGIPFSSVSAEQYHFSVSDEEKEPENEDPYLDYHASDISSKINEAFRTDSGRIAGDATTLVHHMAFSKADFVFAYATAEGYKSYRNEQSGSWFIQALVWLLKYESHREHFIDILTQVNDLVSKGRAKKAGHTSGKKSVSEFETSLRKKLYFFPGLCDFPPERIEGLPDSDSVE